MKNFGKFVVISWVLGVLLFLPIVSKVNAQDEAEKQVFLLREQREQAIKRALLLREQFKQESLWSDEGRREKLLLLLSLAYELGDPLLADVLAPRIADCKLPKRDLQIVTLDQQYPAYRALLHFGVAVVPSLVEELKRTDPPPEFEGEFRQFTKIDLILSCLVQIYNKGGYGKELVQLRIGQEIKKSAGKEKERLEQALKHPRFKLLSSDSTPDKR